MQRKIVRAMVGRTPIALSFKDAPAEGGDWGATVVTPRQFANLEVASGVSAC